MLSFSEGRGICVQSFKWPFLAAAPGVGAKTRRGLGLNVSLSYPTSAGRRK